MGKMRKIMNVICLVLWSLQTVVAIMAMFGLITISPTMYLCAVIICVLHYICELIDT